MNAKSWLNRGRNIDREINVLLAAKEEARDRLTHITQSYDGDCAQMTKDPHKFDRIVELDNMIDQRIDDLYEVKKEIMAMVAKLDDSRHRQILEARYVSGWTWERIAVEINYSYQQTLRLHGYALQAIEVVLNKM